jgi:hypothetical protein
VDKHIILGDDIYMNLLGQNAPAASRECACSLQIIKYESVNYGTNKRLSLNDASLGLG